MSRLTTKIPTSKPDLPSLDQESISSQIDRLTQVIQSLTLDKLSPSCRFHPSHTPSLDSYLDSGKLSIESSLYEEDFLKLERSTMITEDFRSHELRKINNLTICNKLVLELSSESFENFCDDLIRLKNRSEEWVESILNVAGKQLFVKIKDQKKSFVNKKMIGLSFGQSQSKGRVESRNLEGLQKELENCMAQTYKDSFFFEGFEGNGSILYRPTMCEVQNMKVKEKEHRRLIEKLNWQIAEISLIKEGYSGKLQKLSEWEMGLKEKQNEILIQESKICTQKMLFEKDLQIIEQEKKVYLQGIEENKKKNELVHRILDDIKKCQSKGMQKKKSVEGIVLKPRRNEQKSDHDLEIEVLDKEIQGLESHLENDPKSSEYIKTKIDRLKTRLSSLKSKRVINASLERSNSMSSKLNLLDKSKNCSTIGLKIKTTLQSQPLISSNNINRHSKTLSTQSPTKHSLVLESTDDLQSFLKLRESRLTEKEEELSKRENMLINTWGTHPDSLGLVSIVQNEHRNLKILRNDLEKKQKMFEKQVLAQSRKFSELKAKEKKIQETFEGFEESLSEKQKIETKLQLLLSVLENVEEVV